jgi:DUF438 domain-containing protein
MSELIDNRAHRIRTLKGVIRHLHEGRAPSEVKAQLAALVRECDASEIADIEQELMAEGVPATEIMGMCDLHSQVVRDVLVEGASAPPPPGHPLDTFRRENEALGAQVRAMQEALAPSRRRASTRNRPSTRSAFSSAGAPSPASWTSRTTTRGRSISSSPCSSATGSPVPPR